MQGLNYDLWLLRGLEGVIKLLSERINLDCFMDDVSFRKLEKIRIDLNGLIGRIVVCPSDKVLDVYKGELVKIDECIIGGYAGLNQLLDSRMKIRKPIPTTTGKTLIIGQLHIIADKIKDFNSKCF